MTRNKIGIFLSLLLAIGLCSCHGSTDRSNTKLIINEVLIENQGNYQDDYGLHSGWIEIFNKSYSSADLAGCYLKVSSTPGDTVSYFIPKGDILTSIKPRQHALFWADGTPRHGTFHTNFVLSKDKENWIGLFDSGRKLLDQVVVPAGILQANQSYARISDASSEWEVKDDSAEKYVTPSTNNKTIDSNPKMDKFEQHDPVGIGMAISAMSVVFVGLILLYICFRLIGKLSVKLRKQNAMKAHNITDKQEAKEKKLGEAPGEVIAAITMALHEARGADHDVEETILTISRVKRSYSPWSSKIYTLRETPNRK
ncbi:OadG family transporter subunit [uncultured Bacteroides sp.]|uniref:OadG family transporter subunit n=1 Tax=uncultured Bacteroides sp. TaxID=162156 RepID=UPI00262881A7|nr:OadG family transporter subunit [uncultured Bacteroides sp.]